jgi:hypothetical protein
MFDVFGNTNIRAERIVIGRKNKDYDPRKITHKRSFHWGWLGGSTASLKSARASSPSA